MTIDEATRAVPERAATRSVADVLEPLFEVLLDAPPQSVLSFGMAAHWAPTAGPGPWWSSRRTLFDGRCGHPASWV